MSVGVTVDVRGKAPQAVAEVLERIKPGRIAAAVGPAVARLVQRHLVANGTNKRGWPTTNFWARAAKATSWSATEGNVTVSVNQIGARQRYFGGTIRAVNKRALTIPISPVSYGKVASDFPGLFRLRTRKGTYLVQAGTEVSSTKGGKTRVRGVKKAGGNAKSRRVASLNFLFRLASEVTQAADPSVLPTQDVVLETARTAVMGLVRPGTI